MKTYFITVDPEIALYAEQSGVDAIFVDMETRGKAARQGHLNAHLAAHTLQNVADLAKVLRRAELMVRINPPWDGTPSEVRDAMAAGASRLMLPMFRTREDAVRFKAAAGQTPITFLIETGAALARLPSVLSLMSTDDTIHFGLNDLALDLHLSFLFEVLSGRLLDGAASLCREAGIVFGIGGVGRIGQGLLSAHWILGEHVRLGSEWVILSRAFHGQAASLAELCAKLNLATEIAAIQRVVKEWQLCPDDVLRENHAHLTSRVNEIVREQK